MKPRGGAVPGPVRSSRKALVGRADLVRMADAWGRIGVDVAERLAMVAGELGYVREPPRPGSATNPDDVPTQRESSAPELSEVPEVPFWQPRSLEYYGEDAEEQRTATERAEAEAAAEAEKDARRPAAGPEAPPLSPWRRLEPMLRRALTVERRSRTVNIAALMRCWVRGRHLARLPRELRRVWAPMIVVAERQSRAVPYWHDQEVVLRELRRVVGVAGVAVRSLPDGVTGRVLDARGRPARLLGGEPGRRTVLVLGDLGWYGESGERAAWLRLGRQLRRAGAPICALAPVPRGRWTDELARVWGALTWERPLRAVEGPLDGIEKAQRAGALLTLLAPAWRIEPGLVRAMRTCMSRNEVDIGTEVDVWMHADIASMFSAATAIVAERVAAWRERFGAVPAEQQKRAWDTLRAWHWHQGLQPEAWHLEVLSLRGVFAGLGLPAGVFEAEEIERAERFMTALGGDVRRGRYDRGEREEALRTWCQFAEEQAPPDMWDSNTAGGKALQIIRLRVNRHAPVGRGLVNVDLSQMALALGETPRATQWLEMRQVEDALRVDGPPGSFVAALAAAEREVRIVDGRMREVARVGLADARPDDVGMSFADASFAERSFAGPRSTGAPLVRVSRVESLELRTDRMKLRVERVTRPGWAHAIGRDRFGLWAAFRFGGVVQRMRWIPPGRFLMGSPEDEEGRFEDEGPLHEAILTRGYWLGETPVTQALWEAVVGEKPSRFKGADRPVEHVSWEDCTKRFIARLNGREAWKDPVGGEVFRLPSEAEWEYACRARTGTATYAGYIRILGANNAPVLDDIAWYGGNSGVDFELEEGVDSSNWPEKQHEHTRAGSHPVQQKQPNPWGLYDMLGNVWEWCMDGQRPYSSEQQRDPCGDTGGEGRVSRGGSWYDDAQYVRAAFRLALHPGSERVDLGFRLARGQWVVGEQVQTAGALAKLDGGVR